MHNFPKAFSKYGLKNAFSVSEGRQAAKEYNCKFVEIAVILGHHMDELLVGVLAQVRLNEFNDINGQSRPEIVPFDAFPSMFQPRRSSSGASSIASNAKFVKKLQKEQEKWSSLRKLDDAMMIGCTQISSVGERLVSKIFGRRKRSHSLEDLLAFHGMNK